MRLAPKLDRYSILSPWGEICWKKCSSDTFLPCILPRPYLRINFSMLFLVSGWNDSTSDPDHIQTPLKFQHTFFDGPDVMVLYVCISNILAHSVSEQKECENMFCFVCSIYTILEKCYGLTRRQKSCTISCTSPVYS